MVPSATLWEPTPPTRRRVDSLIKRYRDDVIATLDPLVAAYYPSLLTRRQNEYRKMVELSTKMTVVGHAVTESAGAAYDGRRRRIASLFGGCCFLADSFIDDFGDAAARKYLERFEDLLTNGWFQPRGHREELFYVIVSRLFAERDVLDPTLRQAILRLLEAQQRDVELRWTLPPPGRGRRRERLTTLKDCARDRSGHAITVLAAFLIPDMPLRYRTLLFGAGALIMHIDDHGDCYSDLKDNRITYMNQVSDPERTLRSIYHGQVGALFDGLSPGVGRDLFIGFFARYYATRLAKHRQQRKLGGSSWAVYE